MEIGESLPTSIEGRGDMLAQNSQKSPPPQSLRTERANGDLEAYWKHPAPKLNCKKYSSFNGPPSGQNFVGILNRMSIDYPCKLNGLLELPKPLACPHARQWCPLLLFLEHNGSPSNYKRRSEDRYSRAAAAAALLAIRLVLNACTLVSLCALRHGGCQPTVHTQAWWLPSPLCTLRRGDCSAQGNSTAKPPKPPACQPSSAQASIQFLIQTLDWNTLVNHNCRSKAKYSEAAKAAGVPAIISSGIYPGTSNVMAAHIISIARKEYDEEWNYRQPQPGGADNKQYDSLLSYCAVRTSCAHETLVPPNVR
eukprot:1159650-Pelagomonas_calceolata.AAC.10